MGPDVCADTFASDTSNRRFRPTFAATACNDQAVSTFARRTFRRLSRSSSPRFFPHFQLLLSGTNVLCFTHGTSTRDLRADRLAGVAVKPPSGRPSEVRSRKPARRSRRQHRLAAEIRWKKQRKTARAREPRIFCERAIAHPLISAAVLSWRKSRTRSIIAEEFRFRLRRDRRVDVPTFAREMNMTKKSAIRRGKEKAALDPLKKTLGG